MSAHSVRVWAPAKLNLYLAVGVRRADGYHDVTTVLTAIDLFDELRIDPSDELVLMCTPDVGVPEQDNLVYRAAVALAKRVGRKPSGHITLTKRIPHGAGLGGGSSDAAAALVGLAAHWGVNVAFDALEEVAAGLGADVPFFLRGGPSLYVDRGDRFVGGMAPLELDVVVVRPDASVATGAAYDAFDRQTTSDLPGPAGLERALKAGNRSGVAGALYNNMTAASVGLAPPIGDALAWVRGANGVLGAAMAGSGSAVFGVCESAEVAVALAQSAKAHGWWSSAARTVSDGVRACVEGSGS